jgi:hypothetical protein
VRGEDEGDIVKLFRQKAGHRDIPGMRVNDLDLAEFLHGAQVQGQRIDSSLELGLAISCDLRWWLVAEDMQIARVLALRTPAVHLYLDTAG